MARVSGALALVRGFEPDDCRVPESETPKEWTCRQCGDVNAAELKAPANQPCSTCGALRPGKRKRVRG